MTVRSHKLSHGSPLLGVWPPAGHLSSRPLPGRATSCCHLECVTHCFNKRPLVHLAVASGEVTLLRVLQG